MIKKLSGFVIFGFILFYTNSCTKEAYYPEVCFQTEVLPIFLANCTSSGCHNGKDKKEGFDFSNFEGIKEGVDDDLFQSSEIIEVISEGKMPPSGYPQLSEKQINMLKAWINMGAPNTSGCGDVCDTTVFTFSLGVKPILDVHCMSCHNSTLAKGNINFSTYEGVTSIKSFRLLNAIKHNSGVLPMPEGAPKLSDCKIRIIEKWVQAGLLND